MAMPKSWPRATVTWFRPSDPRLTRFLSQKNCFQVIKLTDNFQITNFSIANGWNLRPQIKTKVHISQDRNLHKYKSTEYKVLKYKGTRLQKGLGQIPDNQEERRNLISHA